MSEAPRLILGTSQGLVALDLAGGGWCRGTVLWRGGAVTRLVVESAPRQRIVAAAGSRAVASRDGGRTWSSVPAPRLEADAVAGGVEGRDRWAPRMPRGAVGTRGTSLTGHGSAPGLTGTVNCVIAPAADGGALYAGTTTGVFRSADGGFFWTGAGAGIGEANVSALAETGGALLAAAHGAPQGDDDDDEGSGRLYRLAPGAARWVAVTGPLDGAAHGFAPGREGELLAWTSNGTVLASSRLGARWAAIARGLPAIFSAVVV